MPIRHQMNKTATPRESATEARAKKYGEFNQTLHEVSGRAQRELLKAKVPGPHATASRPLPKPAEKPAPAEPKKVLHTKLSGMETRMLSPLEKGLIIKQAKPRQK